MRRRWRGSGPRRESRSAIRPRHAQGHASGNRHRDGVHVIRRAGRYLVLPRAIFSEASGQPRAPVTGSSRSGTACPSGRRCRRPARGSCSFHHVPGRWKMVLPPNTGRSARPSRSASLAPIYRRSRVVTLSGWFATSRPRAEVRSRRARLGRASGHRSAIHARRRVQSRSLRRACWRSSPIGRPCRSSARRADSR